MSEHVNSSTAAMEKLDASLWALVSAQIDQTEPISVLIRCKENQLDRVAKLVKKLGGRVQRSISRLRIVVAWLSPGQLLSLASDENVIEIGQEDEYVVA
jgi:hypothetical protein